jgi:hypothetical protein
MKISASEISMQSEQSNLTRYSRTETLRIWKGQRPGSTDNAAANRPPLPQVQLSDKALSIQAAEAKDDNSIDPKLKMLISILEAITGKRVKLFDSSELSQPPAEGSRTQAASSQPQADFGMEYDFHESYTEIEQTAVSASGTIRTADGKEISFQLDLSMSRSYYEETNISLRAGNAQRKDPLVINFGGSAAELSDMKFSFDLDGDGSKEQISQFASASGYLALDKNSNGKVDNGLELLGPETDSGFGELAALDGDRNGWIDENDAAFNELKVWVPGKDKLMTLKEAGVGALALAHVNSQFELRGQNNSNLGGIRDTGLFLYEDGGVGSLQEIDLTV